MTATRMTVSLLLSSLAAVTGLAHNAAHAASHFVRGVQFKHRLRVCNAYPYAAGLDIMKGRDVMRSNIQRFGGQQRLTKAPLEYKMCGDFATPLQAGDKLKFMVGGANAGTFAISDLPNNDAILLLVVYRHDTLSNAVAFQSHVFANLLNAQLAAIDTYKGTSRGYAEILNGKNTEKLRYNSALALNPGEYKIRLLDNDKKTAAAETLVALNRESYVVIRVGVEAQHGQQYPQELIVYPASDPALLGSSPRSAAPMVALMLAFVSAALC